jgi:hypothetical protein
MINDQNAHEDDLLATSWLGEVMDVEDPQKMGRVKVKVFGKLDEIPTEDIPWAYPGNNHTGGSATGGGFISVPKKGSLVSVKFDCGNLQHPEYFFLQNISDELKEEIKESYTNAHSIIYDTVTEGSVKIYFTEKKGLMIDYKQSQINIKPDKSIDLHTASGKSKIELLDDGTININASENVFVKCKTADVTASTKAIIDSPKIELGRGATESVIQGNIFKEIFNNHIHPTPAGPSLKPVTPMDPSLSKVSTTK